MKALVQTELTGPQALEVREVPPPKTGDDLLIEVAAAGVGFPDVLMSKGMYQDRLDPPFVPGYEIAGTVVDAGAAARSRVGSRVLAFPGSGGHAQLAVASPAMTLDLPDDLDFVDAIRLGSNYQTALLALLRGDAKAGERALVFGAGGGLGNALVDAASAMGLEVVAVAGSESKLELARAAGATHLIPLGDDVVEKVRQIFPEGVDLVLDPVGGKCLEDGVRLLAVRARLMILGFASGEIGSIAPNRLLIRDADARGVVWGASAKRDPTLPGEIWRELLSLREGGNLNPAGGPTYALDQGARALADIEGRRVVGKAVLTVD